MFVCLFVCFFFFVFLSLFSSCFSFPAFSLKITPPYSLRVRAFTNKTFRAGFTMSTVTFLLGYMYRIAVLFRALKYISILIDIFASNNYFSYRNIFQNGIDTLSKIDDTFFYKQLKIQSVTSVTRNILLEHILFTQIFAFKLFHVSIAFAKSLSSK